MRLACRKCGREYELPADLTARGIYQITCKACGQPVSAEAASESLRQAAGMREAPSAAAPRSAPPSGGPAPRRTPPLASPARPRDDQYVDLFADVPADPEPPELSPGGSSPSDPVASRPVAPPPLPPPNEASEPDRLPALDFERVASGGAGSSRMALVIGSGVVVVLVVGSLLFLRPSASAPPASPPRAESLVISTAPPPLAAPDPEVAAAEARDEAGRYARLRESLKSEGPTATVERHPSPSPASSPVARPPRAVPALVGAVKPPPTAVLAQVPQVPAQGEALAPAVQVAAEPLARPVAGPAATAAVEEAPAFPTAGFEKPSQVVPGCVRNSVRLPRDLAATLSGTLTVRFAVSRNGSVGLIQVMDQVPDSRISDAVVSAVQSCQFHPGTDASGRPTRMWVVMPLRFVGG